MTRFRWLGRETQHGEAASSPNRLLAAFFASTGVMAAHLTSEVSTST